MNLTIDSAQWRPTGFVDAGRDARARLLLGPTLTINGMSFHVEAYAVKVDDEGLQVAADDEFSSEVEAVQSIAGGLLSTQTIDGRDYVICIYPYSGG